MRSTLYGRDREDTLSQEKSSAARAGCGLSHGGVPRQADARPAQGKVPGLRGRSVHKHHRRAENALRRVRYVKLRAQDNQAYVRG